MSKYIQMGFEAICRPPRAEYSLENMTDQIQVPGYGSVRRQPINFPNSRGYNIVGSYYSSNEAIPEPSCIIYLHGNASCQLEGTFLVPIFCPAGVSVLCFDSCACGNSEGEYISLGYFERDDVECAISYIRANYNVGRIALWGRSMGAATVFFVIADEPTIACSVADSPFSSLPQLIMDLGQKLNVPGCLSLTGVKIVAKTVKNKAKFDVFDVEPIKYAASCYAPIMIMHGKDDNFIPNEHSQHLLNAYAGENKVLEIVPGAEHNSDRPIETMTRAIMFIAEALDAPVVIDDFQQIMANSYRHYEDVGDMFEDLQ